VDDPDQTAQLAEDITKLVAEQRGLEKERAAARVHYAKWHDQQAGLEHAVDWCRRVSYHLDRFTYDERRSLLFTLKAEVKTYRADHTPRATLSLSLPLSGPLPGMGPDGTLALVFPRTGCVQTGEPVPG
jgi:hypothetical protein